MPRVNWELPNLSQLLIYVIISRKWLWMRSEVPNCIYNSKGATLV